MIRGGGDLASGVALRLRHAGLSVFITERSQPLVVRRMVSFGEVINAGQIEVEGVLARRAGSAKNALAILSAGAIPVLVDPEAETRQELNPAVLVDARMTKNPPELGVEAAELVIGLGPGFSAGVNCHAVVETQRGHRMGRVIWHGSAQPDTGIPESVENQREERVLRAPLDGILSAYAEIGEHLEEDQVVAEVAGQKIRAPFKGVLRGLIYPGTRVWRGLKIGDVDPRDDPSFAWLVSDKSLAVGGGVLEAIFSHPELRCKLWD
jgi:xanthine dehydrogenase accessory factor